MSRLFRNGTLFYQGKFQDRDFLVDDDGQMIIADVIDIDDFEEVIDCTGIHIFPGFIDMHVHVREPGFEKKETIETASAAAAKGGYTTVFAMPNVNPVPDNLDTLMKIQKEMDCRSKIHLYQVSSITKQQRGKGELVNFDEISQECFLFSDDGRGVQSEDLMKEAMIQCRRNQGVILSHCEEEALVNQGGSIHEGKKSEEFSLVGISSASEYEQVRRDIELVRQTGCQYHICHISTKESVDLVRQAKKDGLPVSAEVTIHHLLLSEEEITENHGRFKMNPPLRTKEDQEALLQGVIDGTIEILATDQAPHTKEEKDITMDKAAMGVVTNEVAFGLLYTNLVREGKISLEQSMELMSGAAADLFGLEGGIIENLEKANLCFFDLTKKQKIQGKNFLSKGKATPFENHWIMGACCMTMVDGMIVYREGL